ncbi:glycosyltransferase [Larkinella bovis]|uniref:Glycosyltransferase n=1 Tax=Larkinella bovis TaxID=683041 RepID=A0ABW0I7B4_9BACT
MLIIDASNVSGGGVVLLQYLVDKIQAKGYEFFLIKKPGTPVDVPPDLVVEAISPNFKRKTFLKKYIDSLQAKRLLCFGNFPPPFKTNIRTITYFHNLHILRDHDQTNHTFPDRVRSIARRMYMRFYLNNSTEFVVQTPLVKDGFVESFNIPADKVKIFPFFNEEKIVAAKGGYERTGIRKQSQTFLYASSSESHKNHINLLNAWRLLAKDGLYPTLLLTISPQSPFTTTRLKTYLQALQQEGVRVNNLGNISYEKLLDHTYSSSFCVFPSLNETLGLGLVEAQLMGNPIAVSQRPFLKYVVKPTVEFDPYDPADIAAAVRKLLMQKNPASELIIQNKVNEFIDFLYQ